MTIATIKKVNARIEKHGIEMIKGAGYFYFMPRLELTDEQACEVADVDSIYVTRVADLSLENWVAHVETAVEGGI